jgi:hypothetical protein
MATTAQRLWGIHPRPALRVRHDLLVASVVGGLLAGAAMIAFAAAAPASRPLALAGATFYGPAALDGGVHVLVAGALLWAAVSALLAFPYGAVVPRDFPFGSAALLGVGYSFGMVVVVSYVLPGVNPVMQAGMHETGGAWVLAYAVFGVALGLVPALRRRLSGA